VQSDNEFIIDDPNETLNKGRYDGEICRYSQLEGSGLLERCWQEFD
jgi:hypothetical protein